MDKLATLLQSIAALLWPLFAFTVLFVFRPQVADLISRLKKGKLFGQEIELEERLELLERDANVVQAEVAALPQPTAMPQIEAPSGDRKSVEQQILGEAAVSPKAALITLATELERLARQLLATTGHLRGRNFVPIHQAVAELHETYGLGSNLPASLRSFWDVRNRLIHRGEGTAEDIFRAIDSGLTILRALHALPREFNVVYEPDVTVYHDENLTVPYTEVHGVMLETQSPGGALKSFRIYPSSKNHFKKGMPVSWEWNMGLVVGQAWYRDQTDGAVKLAWSGSAEFVGRDLREL